MTTEEFVDALRHRSLCISCLATITAPLEQVNLLALFAYDVESRVDTCVACKRDTRMTYRFHRVRDLAA
jgi:hypothetical protein